MRLAQYSQYAMPVSLQRPQRVCKPGQAWFRRVAMVRQAARAGADSEQPLEPAMDVQEKIASGSETKAASRVQGYPEVLSAVQGLSYDDILRLKEGMDQLVEDAMCKAVPAALSHLDVQLSLLNEKPGDSDVEDTAEWDEEVWLCCKVKGVMLHGKAAAGTCTYRHSAFSRITEERSQVLILGPLTMRYFVAREYEQGEFHGLADGVEDDLVHTLGISTQDACKLLEWLLWVLEPHRVSTDLIHRQLYFKRHEMRWWDAEEEEEKR